MKLCSSSQERGVKICKSNNSADTKVSEEGMRGDGPGARANIPLQLVVKTMVTEEITRKGALLGLILTNKEGLVGDVKVKGSLGCNDQEMEEFKILRAGSKETEAPTSGHRNIGPQHQRPGLLERAEKLLGLIVNSWLHTYCVFPVAYQKNSVTLTSMQGNDIVIIRFSLMGFNYQILLEILATRTPDVDKIEDPLL
ncbi:solute carrier family 25 member 40- hypothetical protein [Limosa lapponica baueri]|uniref:Uncharacterized protein n=1 Tax=Limosa lapponica baueri TaxID=1758121 RepID=A0A2I0UIG5_LIMLA|nr:solute carrier family 25 member 40- hypothetical protein [Limosa lapponica baueri]